MARLDRASWVPKPPESEPGVAIWTSSRVRSASETYPKDSIKLVDQGIMAPGSSEPGFTYRQSHNQQGLGSITPKEDIEQLMTS